MKRIYLVLVLMLTVLGCSESSSDSSGDPIKPKPIENQLAFFEKTSPFSARLFADGVGIADRSTPSLYGITNYTRTVHNNVKFSVVPEDLEKYSVSAIRATQSCTTLAYGDGCVIFLNINVKTTDDINVKIKMTSDQGEVIFAPKTIKAEYRLQPTVESLNFGAEETKTFYVHLTTPYQTIIKGGAVFYKASLVDATRVDYVFADGSKNSGYFEMSTANGTRTYKKDGETYIIQNCFSEPTHPAIRNNDVSYCYVDVKRKSMTATGTHTETLTIKSTSEDMNATWRAATVTLTATN